MYYCEDCDLYFDTPTEYVEDRTPYGGPAEPGFSEHYKGCPKCSGGYDEVHECTICGAYTTQDICKECEALLEEEKDYE